MAKPLYDMCASTMKQKTKSLAWTPEGHIAFEKRKALVNNCTKIYFVDYNLPVILYTYASDYAKSEHYLMAPASRNQYFLRGTFQGPQVR